MSVGYPPQPPAAPPGHVGPAAGSGARMAAAIIDVMGLAVAGVVLLTVGGAVISSNPSPHAEYPLGNAIVIALTSGLALGGPVLYTLTGWRRGQTLGMRALNIRVVSVAGGPLSAGQAILRLGGAFWSFALLLLGFFAIAFDPEKRGWHDHIAGSRVIEEMPSSPRGYYGAGWATPQYWGPPPPAPPQGYGPPPGYVPYSYGPPEGPAGWSPPVPAQAPPASPPGDAALQPDPNPVRRAWRSPATWGRSRWTWTDVLPVMALFFPLVNWTVDLLEWIVHRLPHVAPGAVRAAEIVVLRLLSYAGILALLFVLVRLRRRCQAGDLGLGRCAPRWLLTAVPALLAAYVLEISTGVISRSLFPGTPNNQCVGIKAEFAGYLPVAIIVVAVFAPVVEELFCRGFLLRYLRDRMPWWAALVVSAAIFSAAHYSWHEPTIFLPVFTTGLVLGLLYLYSGSIWPGVLTHGLFNLVPVLLLFLGNQSC